MEDSKTAAAVLGEEKTETVQRVLSFSHKPLKIPQGPVNNPMILDSIKECMGGLELLRRSQGQEAMREDLRTKGYVMGWVTDDDE